MTYLGTDPKEAQKEMDDTRVCSIRFSYPKKLYIDQLAEVVEVDAQVLHHRACALRPYLMYLVETFIFMDKSVYYVDVVYLR